MCFQGNLHLDDAVTIGGKVNINPSLAHYYGNSLGGVMGEVYMAATTDVNRGLSCDLVLYSLKKKFLIGFYYNVNYFSAEPLVRGWDTWIGPFYLAN